MAKRSAAMLLLLAANMPAPAARAYGPPSKLVLDAAAQRIEAINRVAPSVVCVFDSMERGGGSGVLIDPEGYGLTNYHVIAGLLGTRRGFGGLGDGVLYELEVLGIDPTGDLAMFRLLPPNKGRVGTAHQQVEKSKRGEDAASRDREGADGLGKKSKSQKVEMSKRRTISGEDSFPFRFPYARLGDSDAVQVGDTAIAMGNPFTLSEDYAPSVTLGIVTGVHRYQWGTRGNLTYTDCIQVDAPINPGSSGGPLFNAAGEIVGINGRISVNTRGRFNVGFGYAVSSNQIKRFIPALRAGLLARHGTWQARVENVETSKRRNVVVFAEVREPGPAYDAGIRVGDKLLSFDGVRIQTANQVASMLGTYPAGWPVPLEIEHGGTRREVVVELQPVEPRLAKPFVVDRNINLRQLKRVLRAFRRSALGESATGGVPEPPIRWKWTVLRHHTSAADGPAGARIPSRTAKAPERFDVSQVGDGPVRMQQRHEDGSAGRLIEYDGKTATQRITEDGESYELTADAQMILGAMYTMRRWLLHAVDELDLTDATHVGGAAFVRRSADGVAHLFRDGGHHSARTIVYPTSEDVGHPPSRVPPASSQWRPSARLAEVIELPVSGHALAGFAFDSESFAIVRVTVRDLVSKARATIRLSDHRDIGGLVWPCTVEVVGDGDGYRDTLSDWELSR